MVNLREWDRIFDGCIQAKYQHKETGEIAIQRKRRSENSIPGTCTWHHSVRCDDHPDKNVNIWITEG